MLDDAFSLFGTQFSKKFGKEPEGQPASHPEAHPRAHPEVHPVAHPEGYPSTPARQAVIPRWDLWCWNHFVNANDNPYAFTGTLLYEFQKRFRNVFRSLFSVLHTPAPHSPLNGVWNGIPHSTLPAPHFLLLTPHFPLPIPHSPLHTSHSTLYTSHSTFHTPHSPQPTPNSIAQCCTCTISDNKSISIYRLKLIQQTSATSPRGINPTDCVVIPQSLYFNISKLIYCKELPQPWKLR